MTGLQRDPKHRYRWNDGEWHPGATGILGMLDKSGPLIGWAKRETAGCAVRNIDTLSTMIRDGGPDAAIKWLAAIPDYQRDKAANLGSRIHVLAEAISRNIEVEVAEEEAPFINAYMNWRFQLQPAFVNVEFMVYSQKHGYGGTADAVLRIGSELWLVDYKTGKGAYPETALQLAAYRFADWAGRTDDPKKYAIPKATRYGVLHIRPEGAQLIPYDVGPAEFDAFLACRALHSWVKDRAPLVQTMREAA